MKNNKSTPIIVIGVAIFIIGAAALFLILRGSDGKSSSTTKRNPVPGASPVTSAVPLQVTPGQGVNLPTGENAIALQMDYFGGIGGYVKAGNLVNVYTIINKDCKDPKVFPAAVKLIFPAMKVLQVISGPAAQSGSPSSFLLAVTPQEAEKLIFNSHVNSLYFTLTKDGDPPATTTGITCTNAF